MPRISKRSLAKLAQRAGRAAGIDGVYDKLPNVDNLEFVRKVSIRLEAVEDIEAAVKRYVFHNNSDFKPVRFFIIDENDGLPIFVAELKPEVGFVVYDSEETNVVTMHITLPNETEGCLGKIQHPSGATIYKVFETGTYDLSVVKIVSEEENFLKITRKKSFCLSLLKCIGLTFNNCYYSAKSRNQTLAKIRPNISCDTDNEHFLIKFPASNSSNTQIRAISIGVGLLLTLEILYPPLKNLLRETIDEQE